MITELQISRFKSISSLTLPCRKVNVFVGPPDTGKTNILDALTFLSCLGWNLGPWDILRLSKATGFEPLFFRQFVDKPIEIRHNSHTVRLTMQLPERSLVVKPSLQDANVYHLHPEPQSSVHIPALSPFRVYRYLSATEWKYQCHAPEGTSAVTPPSGANLIYLARHHSAINEFFKSELSTLASTPQRKPRFDSRDNTYYLSEDRNDEFVNYHLELLSDSVKRFIFYGAVILSSTSAHLVLDEPDVCAFPPYPKILGEMIAADQNNQYFLTTHNPYFLSALIEKTPKDKLAIFVCSRNADGATISTLLSESDMARLVEMGASLFFNLKEFVRS